MAVRGLGIWFGALVLGACGDDGGGRDGTDTVEETAGDTSDTADMDDTDDIDDIDDTAADTADTGDAAEVEVTPDDRPWYEKAVMYEVFVRSFQDSDGDGIGDLRGLMDRLDYLNDGQPGGDDLGVDGLWLMPIMEASSYHGYDTIDYRRVERDYGDNADFEALVAACEARGMKVVLDLVMNHTGQEHPWFVDSRSGPETEHRDWYLWRSDDPGWKQPFGTANVWHRFGGNAYYYGVFSSTMPDLDYRQPAVVAEMTDVAADWLARGAAGFRLDAARYLIESADGQLADQPETHAFWKSLRAALDPEAYLVGEVWTSRAAVSTYYGDGDELHQAFDFDLQGAIVKAVGDGTNTWLTQTLAAQKTAGTPWSYEATFLSNHDLDRLAKLLDDGEQRAAAFLLMTLPGTPYIYYGDELGVGSAPALGDQAKRGPMAWTPGGNHGFSSASPWLSFADGSDVHNVATQLADPASLLRLYQTLIGLRREHRALNDGDLRVFTLPAPMLFGFLRVHADETVLVVVNLSATTVNVTQADLSQAGLGATPWQLRPLVGESEPVEVTDPRTVPIGTAWNPYEGRMWTLAARSGAVSGQ
jgi:alpha-amylase